MKVEGKTIAELTELSDSLCKDPANKGKDGSIFMYTQKTHKKLDRIAREISYKIRAKRIENGETINDSGYSGRKSNRR